ncbi:C39 family peptidase [Deinococcus sp. QL22]|uniref:C39 family peptidase n=1 Tax=Deinococcus sp. QL22 TaxID=2939437 RepID=UPI002017506F|nr:C39 family peptidase [Deinococcus sp. QL22]UQN09369.1 C39 family peptidase [Deinococcus sp. QL22]
MKKRLCFAAPLLAFMPLLSAPAGAALAASSSKVAATPDFLQTDPKAGFASAGAQFCAPTAVSNSLTWLGTHGYPALLPQGSNLHNVQANLIRLLGSASFTNTDPASGTGPAQLMRGVGQYVQKAGYGISELSYEGWRAVPAAQRVSMTPDLDNIRDVIDDDAGAVWLNVGWYRYDENDDTYERSSGHWVTVVGYGGDDLLIHDPATSVGRTERATVTPLASGSLVGQEANLPRAAEEYYELGGSLARENWVAILDGAVFLLLD